FSIIVVSEGAKPKDHDVIIQNEKKDAFGHVRLGGIGHFLGREIENRTKFETRVTVLGHTQRGGSPTAFDRILATRFGSAGIDLVHKGKFGHMASLQGNKIVSVPLEKAVAKLKTVDMELYDLAKVFFG
ncbi:MAG: 6-phosphofructokinase, partial [Candidatus Aminicenantes bacterium]|nr:6-phosphofructokinase [Candidatus Aminicenantes bacterium]